MSWGYCVIKVKNALLQLPDVTETDVPLHPQSAVITMNKLIYVDVFQAQLNKPGHYSIKNRFHNN